MVDAGVKAQLPAHSNLIDLKIAEGTQNYCLTPAISGAQLQIAFVRADNLVAQLAEAGCNLIALGEMGIGNTASSALIAQVLTGIALEDLVGPGTGLDAQGVANKTALLRAALEHTRCPRPAARRH